MDLVMDSNCFIAPTKREARKLGQMLKKQGDMRAIYTDEKDSVLVIFDSYGNTHDTCQRKLGVRIQLALIFRLNGEIYADCSFPNCLKRRNHPLSAVFDVIDQELFIAIYKSIGVDNVSVTNWE